MNKFLIITLSILLFSNKAFSDYTLIIPSPKGTGTSIWGDVVSKELSRFINEPINVITFTSFYVNYIYWFINKSR